MAIGSSLPEGPDEEGSVRPLVVNERGALRRLLRTAYRRKWFLLLPMVLAAGGAAAVLYQIPPEYGATASVMVESATGRPEAPALTAGPGIEPSARVVGEADFLQSASLLGQVVDRLKLDQDREFGEAAPGPARRSWSWLRGQALEALGQTEPGISEPAVDETTRRSRALAALADAVSVSTRPPSPLISITVRSTDKAKAKSIADAVTELYVADKTHAKAAALKRSSELLASRMSQLKKDSDEAERVLSEFRTQSGVISGDGKSTAAQTLTELNTQLNQSRMQTADRESRLKALQRAQSTPASRAGVSEIIANPVISSLQLQEAEAARRVADLSQRYGENYPKLPEARAELAQIQGRIAAEMNKIAVSMQGDVDAARAKEAQLKDQVDQFEKQVLGQRQAEEKIRKLQRDADGKRQAYQDIVKKEGELRDRLESGQAEVRTLAPAAVSSEPVYPKYGRTLYLAALGGLLLGVVWVTILERLDSGFRSTEQIETMMGAPLVGMIPLLSGGEARSSPVRLVLDKPMSVYSEALRLTHTAVTISAADRKAKVIMITSSVPGEGKSTFACSFATLIARSNPRKKVVLIDCDLRRSTVAKLLGDVKTGGTIDQYLAGSVSLDKVFGRVADSGLYYIPSQSNTPNSAELLASADMQAFVGALADQFDLVILDTPPVMAVSDPRIVAKLADFVIFLVRWERTDREVAKTAFRLLAEVSSNVGVVLSQVDLRRHAKYGFSDYAASYSKYRNYYVS